MRLTSKGQVTIPIAKRKHYGLQPLSEVEFIDNEKGLLIVPARPHRDRDVRAILERMRGTATSGLTTDEIMILMRGEDGWDPTGS